MVTLLDIHNNVVHMTISMGIIWDVKVSIYLHITNLFYEHITQH